MGRWTQIKKIGAIATLPLLISACGAEDDTNNIEQSIAFEAGTGMIANATITLESYESNGWQTVQTYSSDENGHFDPTETTYNDDIWYRFTTTDGVVLDLDLDGEIDEATNEFNGQLRSLAKGEWLNQIQGSQIGFYTETAYTHVLAELNKDSIDWQTIETQLDEVAAQLLLKDANGDETIDYSDVLRVSPNDLSYTNFVTQADMKSVLTITQRGDSSILNWMPSEEYRSLYDTSGTTYAHVLSADKSKLYAVNLRNGLYVKDLNTGESSLYDSGHIYNYSLAIDETNQIAYIPNTSNSRVYRLDLETGEQLETILSGYQVTSMAINGSGETAYFSTRDGLHTYDIETEAISVVELDYAQKVRLSEDETRLYISGNDYIALYDIEEGEFLFQIEMPTSAYNFVLNEDETIAYVANSDEGMSIVTLATENVESFASPDSEDVYDVSISPEPGQVVVLSEYGLHHFDVNEKTYIEGPYADIPMDSAYQLTYVEEDNIYIAGEELFALGAYAGSNLESLTAEYVSQVYNVKINTIKNQVAFTEYDGRLGLINQDDQSIDYIDLRGRPNAITISEDGSLYYISIPEVGIDIVNSETLAVSNLTYTAFHSHSLIHQSTNYLYVLDYDTENINVFDLDDNSYVKTIDRNGCGTGYILFDHSQEYLYTACNNNSTGIRRFKLLDESWENFTVYSSQSLAFNSDGSKLFAGQNFQVQILDIASGEVTHTFEGNHVLWGIDYWEEKHAILTGGNSGPSYIDIESGKSYELSSAFGNNFDLDKTTHTLYFGAGSDGLRQIDLSDMQP